MSMAKLLDFFTCAGITIANTALYMTLLLAVLAVMQIISLKVFKLNLFKKFWNTLDKLDKITL